MSDNIEIKVSDNVAPTIAIKIRGIATEAIAADSAIEKLKATIASLNNANPITKLQSEVAKLDSQLIKNIDSQNKLTASGARAATAQQKLSTEIQKTQAALAGTEAALNNAVAAETRAAIVAQQLAAATSRASLEQERLATQQQKTAAAQIQVASQAAQSTQKLATEYQKTQLAATRLESAEVGLIAAQTKSATSTAQLATQEQKTATELQRTATAAQNLQTAMSKTALTDAQAAVATQRLATEQQRTATQTDNAAAAADRAALAALRLQTAQAKAAASASAAANDAEKLMRELYPLYDAQKVLDGELARADSLYKQNAIDLKTYQDAVAAATGKFNNAKTGAEALSSGLVKVANSAKLGRHHLVNLGYQLNDIGISLAGGQNPLLVFIQQGSQIAGIAASAGVSLGKMAAAVAGLLLPFLPLVIVIGAAYAAFKLFQSEVGDQGKLKAYAKELGYTSQQIKKLNADHVTFGDTLKGLWATLTENNGAGGFFTDLQASAVKAFKNILGYAALSVQSLLALFSATISTLEELWNRLPVSFKKPIAEVINFFIAGFETFTNKAIIGLNLIIQGLNAISNTKIDLFEKVDFGRVSTDFAQASGKDLSEVFVDSYIDNLKKNQASTSKFLSDWEKNTALAARKRIKDNDPNADKNAERRSTSLNKINMQLDNELQRLNMLKPAREQQQKFDTIEEQLAGKKITLNKDEADSIKSKIVAIQQASYVQSELDRIYEEAVSPQRTYNATLQASDMLLKQGAISQDQFNRQVIKGAESYAAANDPLYQYNKGLNQQADLLKLLPKQREVEAQMQGIQNDLLQQGIVLNQADTDQLRQKLKAMQELANVSQALDQIYSETQGAQSDLIDKQKATNQAYADGLINLDDYSRRLVKIGVDYANLKLQMGEGSLDDVATASLGKLVESYEGVLSGLSDSFGTFFQSVTDGFADSIGKAIVQGEDLKTTLQSVAQDALGSLISGLIKLGIQWVVNAALGQSLAATALTTQTALSVAAGAATAAAWAPAAAMTSLASFGANAAPASAGIISTTALSQSLALTSMAGFKDGGWTGGIAANDVAGVVHGQEFVMDAAATRKIGVGNLEALRNGAANVQKAPISAPQADTATTPQQNGSTVGTPNNIRIINTLDPALVGDFMATPEGEQLIVNTMRRNSDQVKAIANG